MNRTIWDDRLVATAITLSHCSLLPEGLFVGVVHWVLATGRADPLSRGVIPSVCVVECDQVQQKSSTPTVSR